MYVNLWYIQDLDHQTGDLKNERKVLMTNDSVSFLMYLALAFPFFHPYLHAYLLK